MPNFSKILLSQSINGRSIPVTVTGFVPLATGNLLHSGVAGTVGLDEIWLYANNNYSGTNVIVTVQWGNSGDYFSTQVPFNNGRILLADGRLINNALNIYAVASFTGCNIDGFVNRII